MERKTDANRDPEVPRYEGQGQNRSEPRYEGQSRDRSRLRCESQDRDMSVPRYESQVRNLSAPRYEGQGQDRNVSEYEAQGRDQSRLRCESQDRHRSAPKYEGQVRTQRMTCSEQPGISRVCYTEIDQHDLRISRRKVHHPQRIQERSLRTPARSVPDHSLYMETRGRENIRGCSSSQDEQRQDKEESPSKRKDFVVRQESLMVYTYLILKNQRM
ncbi:uncharacterized protein LOC119192244 [Manduca sexta]|uniref:uncharacterized protein LOC119192244 n=1 Tax=Manduca sexta TaxID=7130 RepID=UPI00188F42FA|nr:uncharacterized protein LOC119192244 [Manduca sexta]